MSPRFVVGRENVPCVAEVVNRSLKADCTDFTNAFTVSSENIFTNHDFWHVTLILDFCALIMVTRDSFLKTVAQVNSYRNASSLLTSWT